MKPTKICTFTECGRKVFARNLCQSHYLQNRAGKEMRPIARPITDPICMIDGCHKARLARGWCPMHYQRWAHNGDPNISLAESTLEQRFWERVRKTSTCWNWTGEPSDTGYGQITFDKTWRSAHRASWELHHGPIPEGMVIDHRCHNRACVRPSHLRVGTQKQNVENHQGATKASATGVRGVFMDKRYGTYYVQVTHNRKTRSLSGFANIEEAEAMAIATRNELHTYNDRDRIAA